jgi:hypothetical protein
MGVAAAVEPFIKLEGRVLQTSLMCTQDGDDYCFDVMETLDDDGEDVEGDGQDIGEGECESANYELNSCTDLGECGDIQGFSSCCQMTETIMELEINKFLCPYIDMVAKEFGAEAMAELLDADPDCPTDFDALCSLDSMALLSRGMSLVRQCRAHEGRVVRVPFTCLDVAHQLASPDHWTRAGNDCAGRLVL